MTWEYEKLDENYEVRTVNDWTNDMDGAITGRIVLNVKAWLDENPEERIRLGWTKHIKHTAEEIRELCPYNEQTQYLVTSVRQIDEWTVEDTYHALNKSEEMLRLEELFSSLGFGASFTFN